MVPKLDMSKILDWLPNAKTENVIATSIVSSILVYTSTAVTFTDKFTYAIECIFVISSLTAAVSIGALIGRILTYCHMSIITKERKKSLDLEQKKQMEVIYEQLDTLPPSIIDELKDLKEKTLNNQSYEINPFIFEDNVDMFKVLPYLEKQGLVTQISHPINTNELYKANDPLIRYFDKRN